MKTADVKVGEQYYATVSGGRVRVTVLGRTENFAYRAGAQRVLVVKFRCRNEHTGREVVKSARQLTPVPRERAPGMDDAAVRILVRNMKAGRSVAPSPDMDMVRSAERHLALPDGSDPKPTQAAKPVVVGYTTDGLPLVSTDCPAHGTLCADAYCARRETPAERHARIYADAMNH